MKYDIKAIKVGRFCSLLEAKWDDWFAKSGLHAEYIGDHDRSCDFVICGATPAMIEIKPTQSHVASALDRFSEAEMSSAFVVIGEPPGDEWFYWDSGYENNPILVTNFFYHALNRFRFHNSAKPFDDFVRSIIG